MPNRIEVKGMRCINGFYLLNQLPSISSVSHHKSRSIKFCGCSGASDRDGFQELCLFFLHLENPSCCSQQVFSESVANLSENIAERSEKRTRRFAVFIKVPLSGLFQLLGWCGISSCPCEVKTLNFLKLYL